MRYLASRTIWFVTLGFLIVGWCFEQTAVRVNQTAIRIQFHSGGTVVFLPLENQTDQTI
jgi:hypothetical protein